MENDGFGMFCDVLVDVDDYADVDGVDADDVQDGGVVRCCGVVWMFWMVLWMLRMVFWMVLWMMFSMFMACFDDVVGGYDVINVHDDGRSNDSYIVLPSVAQ